MITVVCRKCNELSVILAEVHHRDEVVPFMCARCRKGEKRKANQPA